MNQLTKSLYSFLRWIGLTHALLALICNKFLLVDFNWLIDSVRLLMSLDQETIYRRW
ncbi:hypothetical protein CROQUDRAFT_164632 [Cronartium quercuum f. sp. fusiforme G11]|uniref:Uncharacterized protein n=1 Tax=Cronartium quercuum f. sp. fusiforme G11 TaxID=708437 RepID=A0A9P6NHT1_9BASI|nr:hypothetical protein CROQUDRAFT_164632 [Cronartium quercuum f. sp. fusiforme G11]